MPGAPAIGGLLERASDLTRAVGSLTSSAAQATSVELRQLLRAMNSYYTNRMEGDHTRPSDIERALADDFSANADLARKQRLAVLHMAAERDCEQVLDYSGLDDNEIVRGLYESGSLIWLHYELFSQLPESDLRIAGSGRFQPGTLREGPVKVGIHEGTDSGIDRRLSGALVRGLRWRTPWRGIDRCRGCRASPPDLGSSFPRRQRTGGQTAHTPVVPFDGPHEWTLVATARVCALAGQIHGSASGGRRAAAR